MARDGNEPSTSRLSGERSTSELPGHHVLGDPLCVAEIEWCTPPLSYCGDQFQDLAADRLEVAVLAIETEAHIAHSSAGAARKVPAETIRALQFHPRWRHLVVVAGAGFEPA